MRANLAKREPDILDFWDEIDIYQNLREAGKGKEKWVLHDGPPYANGALHIGHAVNKILKDVIIKSKTLAGYDSPYVPGWDCHGLPIEHEVEKKLGRDVYRQNPGEFRKACAEICFRTNRCTENRLHSYGCNWRLVQPVSDNEFRDRGKRHSSSCTNHEEWAYDARPDDCLLVC